MDHLNFTIDNQSGLPDSQVFVSFYFSEQGIYSPQAVWQDGKVVPCNQWHRLSHVMNGCSFSPNASGRVYIAYSDHGVARLPPMLPNALPSAFACQTRIDKFEMTYDGTACGCADLTAIDYWAIPMSLASSRQGKSVGALSGIRNGHSAADICQSLSALSNPVQSDATITEVVAAFEKAGHPLATGILDWFEAPKSAVRKDRDGKFLRIVGPNTYPPFGNPALNLPPGRPVTPYDTFEGYLKHLAAGNDKDFAHIAGRFNGVGAHPVLPAQKPQDYDFTARLDPADGALILSGSTNKGTAPEQHRLKVPKMALLNPAASYGGAPHFALDRGPLQPVKNDVYGWIWGDFFAGLNIGALGSTVKLDGTEIGSMPSQKWFEDLPNAGLLFENLWPDLPAGSAGTYWNQWAATLNPMSDAYNFAYAERFSAPQLNLDPAKVDTLTLTLLDTSGVE